MSQPKFIQFLILLLFIGVVTLSILFLLRMQLNTFMNGTGDVVVTGSSVTQAPTVVRMPTATMFALTLDMLATVQPTATSAISVAGLPSPVAPALAASTTAATGSVNTDLVNIRSYPSLAGDVVGQARQGTQVQIIEKSNDGQWLHVCCPLGTSESSIQSWISSEFIDLAPEPTLGNVAATTAIPASVSTPSNGIRATVSTLANLRNGPDTSYATVGQVNEQTQLTITGRNETGTWWRICCPAGAPSESWVSAELVTLGVPQADAMAQVSVVPVLPAPTPIPTSAGSNPTPVLSAP